MAAQETAKLSKMERWVRLLMMKQAPEQKRKDAAAASDIYRRYVVDVFVRKANRANPEAKPFGTEDLLDLVHALGEIVHVHAWRGRGRAGTGALCSSGMRIPAFSFQNTFKRALGGPNPVA